MSSNIQPNLNPTKDLTNFRFWCQKVLPLVYDDSLSYYEVLGKMVTYLNTAIDNVNTDAENVLTLNEAFLELQNYVNNFFDDIGQLPQYVEQAQGFANAANTSAINASESSLAAMDARDQAVAAKNAAEDAQQSVADNAEIAVNAKDTAVQSANTATTKAGEASTSALNAANSAVTAQGAQASASQSSTLAQTAAQTAVSKANEASQSATNAADSAEDAEQAKTDIQENLDNIQQNTNDIADLKNAIGNFTFPNIEILKNILVPDFAETSLNYRRYYKKGNTIFVQKLAGGSGGQQFAIISGNQFAIKNIFVDEYTPTEGDLVEISYFNLFTLSVFNKPMMTTSSDFVIMFFNLGDDTTITKQSQKLFELTDAINKIKICDIDIPENATHFVMGIYSRLGSAFYQGDYTKIVIDCVSNDTANKNDVNALILENIGG